MLRIAAFGYLALVTSGTDRPLAHDNVVTSDVRVAATVAMNGSNMGGPANLPLMNNGAAGGGPQAHTGNDSRTRLNTYIYEYFLKNEQWDCARAMLSCDLQLQVNSNSVKNSPGRRRDENGNLVNGADDHMESDVKGEGGIKRPDDLPAPDIPEIGDSTFLYDWWCLFWDMYGAQRNKSDSRPQTLQYLNHTQVRRGNDMPVLSTDECSNNLE